jgi:hypothetical protein
VRLFASHGETGKLLTEPFALTFGASGFVCAQHNNFKLVLALLADVLKDWHINALV